MSLFDHEKLKVYREAIRFVTWSKDLHALKLAAPSRRTMIVLQRAHSMARAGMYQQADKELSALPQRLSPQEHAFAASAYAVAAEQAGKDKQAAEEPRQRTVKELGDHSLEHLRAAKTGGYSDFRSIASDPGFQSLRSRADFQQLFRK